MSTKTASTVGKPTAKISPAVKGGVASPTKPGAKVAAASPTKSAIAGAKAGSTTTPSVATSTASKKPGKGAETASPTAASAAETENKESQEKPAEAPPAAPPPRPRTRDQWATLYTSWTDTVDPPKPAPVPKPKDEKDKEGASASAAKPADDAAAGTSPTSQPQEPPPPPPERSRFTSIGFSEGLGDRGVRVIQPIPSIATKIGPAPSIRVAERYAPTGSLTKPLAAAAADAVAAYRASVLSAPTDPAAPVPLYAAAAAAAASAAEQEAATTRCPPSHQCGLLEAGTAPLVVRCLSDTPDSEALIEVRFAVPHAVEIDLDPSVIFMDADGDVIDVATFANPRGGVGRADDIPIPPPGSDYVDAIEDPYENVARFVGGGYARVAVGGGPGRHDAAAHYFTARRTHRLPGELDPPVPWRGAQGIAHSVVGDYGVPDETVDPEEWGDTPPPEEAAERVYICLRRVPPTVDVIAITVSGCVDAARYHTLAAVVGGAPVRAALAEARTFGTPDQQAQAPAPAPAPAPAAAAAPDPPAAGGKVAGGRGRGGAAPADAAGRGAGAAAAAGGRGAGAAAAPAAAAAAAAAPINAGAALLGRVQRRWPPPPAGGAWSHTVAVPLRGLRSIDCPGLATLVGRGSRLVIDHEMARPRPGNVPFEEKLVPANWGDRVAASEAARQASALLRGNPLHAPRALLGDRIDHARGGGMVVAALRRVLPPHRPSADDLPRGVRLPMTGTAACYERSTRYGVMRGYPSASDPPPIDGTVWLLEALQLSCEAVTWRDAAAVARDLAPHLSYRAGVHAPLALKGLVLQPAIPAHALDEAVDRANRAAARVATQPGFERPFVPEELTISRILYGPAAQAAANRISAAAAAPPPVAPDAAAAGGGRGAAGAPDGGRGAGGRGGGRGRGEPAEAASPPAAGGRGRGGPEAGGRGPGRGLAKRPGM